MGVWGRKREGSGGGSVLTTDYTYYAFGSWSDSTLAHERKYYAAGSGSVVRRVEGWEFTIYDLRFMNLDGVIW